MMQEEGGDDEEAASPPQLGCQEAEEHREGDAGDALWDKTRSI